MGAPPLRTPIPLLQAFSGLMMQNGDEGGPPTRIGTSILDYGTGIHPDL